MKFPFFDNEKDREIILKNFPSLEKVYSEYDDRIKKGGCSSCVKKRLKNRILKTVRNETPVYGNDFYSSLSEDSYSIIQKTSNKKSVPKKKRQNTEREYCEECIKKHLCSVLVLMTEFQEGYVEHKAHAEAELEQAKQEGFELDIDLEPVEPALRKIRAYLGIRSNERMVVGSLNTAEEFCDDEDTRKEIRNIRNRFM